MKYSKAKLGRTFIIALEDGEIIHNVIEKFALEHSIDSAFLSVIGAANSDSTLIVGPQNKNDLPITPLEHKLNDAYEITGNGTLFPDEKGNPILHMHISCGRQNNTITGCIRKGVKTWKTVEIILTEILDSTASRNFDPATGFKILNP